jgi:hypothetical protein
MSSSAMADGVGISSDLKAWASDAGFSLTPVDNGGRAVFATSDGEIRYFVEKVDEIWFRVTCSNRMGPEQFELAAPSLSTIETYFYGSFGSDIRDNAERTDATPDTRRLDGRFQIGPAADADLARLQLVNDADEPYLALFDQDQVIAVDGFDEVIANIRLTDLAVYLSVDNEDIKAAFTDDDGLDSNREPLLIVDDDDEGEGTGVGTDEGVLV